ncbi:AI-2E family transporter [Pseudoroseicyclus aestuarii]|uniref:Putative PurR-regulated permease PerM n=1 Tax=Pseudoroseicyclus aestuarii TaxID=1795041 RepID=A0A318T4U7_9RHOB|nr:AI-2E family transporter [Pseudoroseicyclus aestuarii]PYE85374.1 putative PurR-regulated permease PerM [Pseudoroseicyclus aestuarii]
MLLRAVRLYEAEDTVTDTHEMRAADMADYEEHERLSELRKIRRLILCLLLLSLFTAIYFSRDVLLPIVLAILLTLTLRPLVRGLQRIGIPPPLTAVGVLLVLGMALFTAVYMLSGPVTQMANNAPIVAVEVRSKLEGVIDRFASIQEMQDQVSGMGGGNEDMEVTVDQSGMLPQAVGSAASVGTSIAAALILTMFLLASGDFYHRRIVEASPRLRDKVRALTIVRDVERQISRYLAAITIINAGLGLCIGLAMWALGMPMPYMWGLVGFLLNFMPLIGAVMGVIGAGAIALVTFDSVPYALLVPGSYFLLTSIEGNVVTPALVGRRLELNIVAVFVTVAFWVWLWGIPGAVLAVPFLVVVKAICDNIDSLHAFGGFLSGAQAPARSTDTAPSAKSDGQEASASAG